MRNKISRRFASYGLVVALCAASVLIARGTRHPFSTQAPDFRGRGPADAKVLIVEFSDFQCPACRVAEPTARQILSLYDGRVRFVFKDFPLRMHEWARAGAYAAECAGRQGQFWPYHDRLYDHQDEWTNAKADDFLAGYARDLKLDMAAFDACRLDPATKAAVDTDVKDGGNAWVSATPTFFIDGRRFVGFRELAELGIPFIDKELKK
jgi:protein-disulfide isomerase